MHDFALHNRDPEYGPPLASTDPLAQLQLEHASSIQISQLNPRAYRSVPYLGHFPSEKTGNSLFSVIHPDDTPLLHEVHRELRAGVKLARSSGIRFVAHDGRVWRVNSGKFSIDIYVVFNYLHYYYHLFMF